MPSDDYFAGLFDGEGSFGIAKRGGRGEGFQAKAHISLRERYILELLVRRFGGFVSKNFRQDPKRHAQTWRWNITGPSLLEFCRVMRDKLFVKRAACQIILEYQTIKTANTGFRQMSTETKRILGELYQDLRYVNRKGPGREIFIPTSIRKTKGDDDEG